MADAYTTTSTLGLDQAAYDLAAYNALRAEMYYDQVATVRPAPGNLPGTSTIFRFMGDLAVATTALSEAVDVDAVAMSDSTVTLTLAEYGNAVTTTALARYTAYIPLDPEVANVVGFNAGESIDTIAGNVLAAGTNVRYATGGAADPTSRTTVDTDDVLTAADIRRALADLRTAAVQGPYVGFIHPEVSYDIRGTTGTNAWSDPVAFSAAERRWEGYIGRFEGIDWIETPRAPKYVNASNNAGATGNIDVYRTIVVGQQALAKTFAAQVGPRPTVQFGPVVDKLMRFRTIGWYWLGAYGIFRQAAVRGIESTSSIANNTA